MLSLLRVTSIPRALLKRARYIKSAYVCGPMVEFTEQDVKGFFEIVDESELRVSR
jgi:hypothetical protein